MMAKDIAEDSGQWIEDRGEDSGLGSRERKDLTKVRQRVQRVLRVLLRWTWRHKRFF